MATKKPRKSGKKSKQTAKVELDAATVHQFEAHLRDGLVSSAAVIATDNKPLPLKAGAKVKLDRATVARLSEALRKGLVASNALIATEVPPLDKMTKKIKSGSTRSKSKKSGAKKGGAKKSGSKKR